MTLLKAKDLRLGYEGKVIADGLSFEIDEGDYLCILGENGSGKSTLMRTLLGLNKPMGGKVEYSAALKKTEIGYLPQQTEVQKDFPATVREIVMSGFQGGMGLRPFYNKAERDRAEEIMEMLDVTPLAKRCYRELSGGQQQRVLLSRALCATGKMILLDEPVAGLDPKVTTDMYFLIDMINKKGITVVMISHDVECARRYATKVLHMGQKRFFGAKEDYLSSEIGRKYLAASGVSLNG